MKISKHFVQAYKEIKSEYFDLPEKVLQFGTGVLLRGLPDYFIDKANKQGIFNGRIVVVKSTGGDVDDFNEQDNIYTHRICGIENGTPITRTLINTSISRVLSAQTNWNDILQCAANPQLQVIISNTTEVGIVLVEDDIDSSPPLSFPGKLLAFLLERFRVFRGAPDKGFVIVPTELITDNAAKLKDIVLQLAGQHHISQDAIDWINHCNHFCNSLVDRIVPGKLAPLEKESLEKDLGAADDLMIISEPYALWAIESGNNTVNNILSFSGADEQVIIAPDITVYRELKLRLLNGTHTFCCGLAYLSGFDTVKEAMDDTAFETFMQALMLEEIIPAITSGKLSVAAASVFAHTVLDRFRNPYIEHKWINITLQYSSKMAMRNVPVISNYYHRTGKVPEHMARGFAAHILFMNCHKADDGKYYGERKGKPYPVNDDNAERYSRMWEYKDPAKVVKAVLSDTTIWGTDLSTLAGFEGEITTYLHELKNRYESISG